MMVQYRAWVPVFQGHTPNQRLTEYLPGLFPSQKSRANDWFRSRDANYSIQDVFCAVELSDRLQSFVWKHFCPLFQTIISVVLRKWEENFQAFQQGSIKIWINRYRSVIIWMQIYSGITPRVTVWKFSHNCPARAFRREQFQRIL